MSDHTTPGRPSVLLGHAAQWKWFFPIYLFLAMANVRTKALITYGYFNGVLLRQHDQLIHGMCRERPQYRVLGFLIPELLHRVSGLRIIDAYILQRIAWTCLSFCAFHLYLRKWFSTSVSAIGTLFFAATMQWVYFDHLHESEPLNILIFVLGLWAIRENAWRWLLCFVIIGSLNKETVILLPLTYFVCWYRVIDFKKLLSRTAALFVWDIAIWGGIAWWYRNTPNDPLRVHLGHLMDNLSGIVMEIPKLPLRFFVAPHLGLLFMYGVFWIIAFMSYREKPLFLRRAALIIPIFCACHLYFTRLCEYRPYLALAPILIPMGLWYLFGGARERPHNGVAAMQ